MLRVVNVSFPVMGILVLVIGTQIILYVIGLSLVLTIFVIHVKVNDPVIDSVPPIVILLLKFDKVLKNNFNGSIL